MATDIAHAFSESTGKAPEPLQMTGTKSSVADAVDTRPESIGNAHLPVIHAEPMSSIPW